MSLFEEISEGRPESVAEGVLAYALADPKERALRKHISALLRRSEADDFKVVRQFSAEEWRPDLVLRWSDRSLKSIELKLAANFTANQERALIDLVVHPSGRLPTKKGKYERTTWLELAGLAQDRTVRRLLAEADKSASWMILDEFDMRLALKSFVDENNSRPVRDFVNTVHQFILGYHLKGYQASRCHGSQAQPPYYGYYFEASGVSCWLGVTAKEHGESQCVLHAFVRSKRFERHVLGAGLTKAEKVAKGAVARLRKLSAKGGR